MKPPRKPALLRAVCFALCAALSACALHPDEHFESVCQLLRKTVVDTNDQGRTTAIDLELEWDPCPGDQIQFVRGGAEFAQCMTRYRVGDLVPVRVLRRFDPRGFHRWDVYQVGGCRRAIEPNSEGSFERSQECNDTLAYGQTVGFRCLRQPWGALVRVCPWMQR